MLTSTKMTITLGIEADEDTLTVTTVVRDVNNRVITFGANRYDGTDTWFALKEELDGQLNTLVKLAKGET